MTFSNLWSQYLLRHLLVLFCSMVLLVLTAIVVPPLIRESQIVSVDAANSSYHAYSIGAFDWPTLLLLILTVHLASRQIDRRRFWIGLPLFFLLFMIIGIASAGIQNWSGLQVREFPTIASALINGLQMGLQAAFYWLVYLFSAPLFRNDDNDS